MLEGSTCHKHINVNLGGKNVTGTHNLIDVESVVALSRVSPSEPLLCHDRVPIPRYSFCDERFEERGMLRPRRRMSSLRGSWVFDMACTGTVTTE